jgi:hypothetical protein
MKGHGKVERFILFPKKNEKKKKGQPHLPNWEDWGTKTPKSHQSLKKLLNIPKWSGLKIMQSLLRAELILFFDHIRNLSTGNDYSSILFLFFVIIQLIYRVSFRNLFEIRALFLLHNWVLHFTGYISTIYRNVSLLFPTFKWRFASQLRARYCFFFFERYVGSTSPMLLYDPRVLTFHSIEGHCNLMSWYWNLTVNYQKRKNKSRAYWSIILQSILEPIFN